MICTVTSLDHLVLTVASIPATVAFYQHLGMVHDAFHPPSAPTTQRHSLLFGASKINLHQAGAEFEPRARTATPGSADLCFIVEEDVERVAEKLQDQAGVKVLALEAEGSQQIVRRTGARGSLKSIYVRDPDGNLVELSNYTDRF